MLNTYESGDTLPVELVRSTKTVVSSEVGEPLLRMRFGGGSRSELIGADEALASDGKWRGEYWRSTMGGKAVVTGAATAVDMLPAAGSGGGVHLLYLTCFDIVALQRSIGGRCRFSTDWARPLS